LDGLGHFPSPPPGYAFDTDGDNSAITNNLSAVYHMYIVYVYRRHLPPPLLEINSGKSEIIRALKQIFFSPLIGSGVARVPCALGQEIFLRTLSTKTRVWNEK